MTPEAHGSFLGATVLLWTVYRVRSDLPSIVHLFWRAYLMPRRIRWPYIRATREGCRPTTEQGRVLNRGNNKHFVSAKSTSVHSHPSGFAHGGLLSLCQGFPIPRDTAIMSSEPVPGAATSTCPTGEFQSVKGKLPWRKPSKARRGPRRKAAEASRHFKATGPRPCCPAALAAGPAHKISPGIRHARASRLVATKECA